MYCNNMILHDMRYAELPCLIRHEWIWGIGIASVQDEMA